MFTVGIGVNRVLVKGAMSADLKQKGIFISKEIKNNGLDLLTIISAPRL